MKIDEWVVREVIDTLHQANITLLGITGLDSEREFTKKCVENETAINRRIYKYAFAGSMNSLKISKFN